MLFLLAACAKTLTGPLDAGVWGNDQAVLTVSADSSHLEMSCAHGSIPGRFTVSDAKAFDLAGTLTLDQPGPAAPVTHPARFTGTTSGDDITITARTTDTNVVRGPFTLKHGVTRSLFCGLE